MEIRRGSKYIYKGGWFGNGHLEGKKVVALDDGGTGIFSNSNIDVRCECCGRTYKVDAYSLS